MVFLEKIYPKINATKNKIKISRYNGICSSKGRGEKITVTLSLLEIANGMSIDKKKQKKKN